LVKPITIRSFPKSNSKANSQNSPKTLEVKPNAEDNANEFYVMKIDKNEMASVNIVEAKEIISI
jgi:hypothetical protein